MSSRSQIRLMKTRVVLVGLLVLGLGNQVWFASGQPTDGKAEKKSSPATKKASGPPRHDAPEMPFRRAPMNVATRTVHLPLATNLHLAFDTELLRTHTVWQGGTLNLWGTPYHAAKDRFYCDFAGLVLWTNAPVMPWTYKRPDKEAQRHLDTPPATRFTGLSTTNGAATLHYELKLHSGQVVAVKETPSRRAGLPEGALERRFEIGPCEQSLTLLAHAESGNILPTPQGLGAVFMELNGRVLLVAARADCNLRLQSAAEDVQYDSTIWVENKNDSAIRHTPHAGQEARCYVRIPVHEKPVVVEVLSIVASSVEEAVNRLQALPKTPLLPAGSVNPVATTPAKIVPGDKTLALPGGDAHYRLERFPLPREIELQVTGMDFLPNGDLAVCTWLGDVWIVQGATNAPAKATYRRFARGLCEPGGLRVVNGEMFIVQKQELTRLRDTDGNGEADVFECLTQDWGFTGNYHDFSFGPAVDAAGNLYVMRNGNRGLYEIPRMGWCLRVSRDTWDVQPLCYGLRSPNSFGEYQGDIFMGDNQGNWIAANTLSHMRAGKFFGFPSTRPAPREDFLKPSESRLTPPAIWFPYKLAKSVSGLATVPPDARFGPFAGQMLAGDFQNAIVMRVALEKVNGEWQGAVFPFARGFESGVNRLAFGPDGHLYVGGCKNRAWAAVAPKEWSLERVAFTGKAPFEIKEVHAQPDGFELTFTAPVDTATAGDKENYDMLQYRHQYHEKYGSPEYDHDGKENSATAIEVKAVKVSADGLKASLLVSGWKAGYVTMVRALDVTDKEGRELRHDTFWYTLNAIPTK
jgi:glucose/arabinose dehydrogenase